MGSLCAGSITIFSLYGHLFLTRLHYSQYEVNAISIAAELALYLPVPVFGYLVDRYSPRPISLFAAILFCFGYVLAGFTYRAGPPGEGGWPVGIMMVAFVAIGMATCSMYLAGVTACVKNFGRGKHRGLALSLPIASFSLSGMWQSQVGSQVFFERDVNGVKGDVDVFRFFLFLGLTLLGVGLVGTVCQVVVDEDELIDETVEELERSGILDDSTFCRGLLQNEDEGYGTLSRSSVEGDMRRSWYEEEEKKKTLLLNEETRLFLCDHTMWFLALGFFMLTGPVETYINNFGTIIDTLYPPPTHIPSSISPANQITILAITSTLARFIAGAISDVLAPVPPTTSQYIAVTPASQHGNPFDELPKKRFTISRLSLLLATPILLIISYVLLLAVVPRTPSIFPLVTALIGIVNGASFSLVPILISTVWGVTNFGTNWGIVAMMPALGATVWSIIYSVAYQSHTGEDGLCFGADCWNGAVGGMLGAAILAFVSWIWVGWGRNAWWQRGVVV
jgi:MFS family permease